MIYFKSNWASGEIVRLMFPFRLFPSQVPQAANEAKPTRHEDRPWLPNAPSMIAAIDCSWPSLASIEIAHRSTDWPPENRPLALLREEEERKSVELLRQRPSRCPPMAPPYGQHAGRIITHTHTLLPSLPIVCPRRLNMWRLRPINDTMRI